MEKKQRKVQDRTIESRKKLLCAAYQLFAEKGYYHTNTKEIARAAGVSVGNFYNYFKDKSDIYCELSEQHIMGQKKALIDAFSKIEESESDIHKMADIFTGYIDKQMARALDVNHFFADLPMLVADIPRLFEYQKKVNQEIQNIIKEFLASHPQIKKRASNEVMARMLFTMAEEISKSIIVTKNTDIYQEYLDEMIYVMLHYTLGIEWKRER